jgi:NAD(P)-dependent dehydrogenase (short-subunit alcohol dehydrogenase family)
VPRRDAFVTEDTWTAPELEGRVALVTGASKGVGRGIAEVLGECGATVYVTARSDAIDAVAESIGGVAVRCDHGSDEQVQSLFEQIHSEQGRLDLLVSNAVGWGDFGSDSNTAAMAELWEKPMKWWDTNFNVGVRSHLACCHFGLPLMLEHGGLIVFTSEFPQPDPKHQDVVLDGRAHATARMAQVIGLQLKSERIACLVVVPGFPRTEGILEAWESHNDYFKGWTEEDFYAKTESVRYGGRGVASLAADPDVMKRSGDVLRALDLARTYGFTDVGGRLPEPVGGA